MQLLKRLVQPKILLPAFISIALIGALLSFGNIGKMIHAVQSFQVIYLLWIFFVIAAYEVVRGWQWIYLLRQLNIHASIRAEILAFLGSEMVKSIPVGNYFQNYLLNQEENADIGLTSAATTFQVLAEVAAALLGLVIFGLGTWSFYLRVVIIGGLLVFGAIVWIVSKRHSSGHPPDWLTRHRWGKTLLEELKRFREGAKDLLHPHILVIAFINSVVYVVIAGLALYLTARGLGLHVSVWSALAVYDFSLAFALIFPLPTDIGAAEFSGTGALLVVGVEKAAAVSTMLIFRLLNMGYAFIIALVGALVLHDELREVFQHKDQHQQDQHREPQHASSAPD